MTHAPHIMLFDLYTGGHRGQYVRQLVEYWVEHALPGRLDVVVPQAFLDYHSDVAQLIKQHGGNGVGLVPIDEPVTLDAYGLRGLLHSDRVHGRLLRTYLHRLRPDYAVCLFFDHIQLSLAFDLRFSFPVRLSGIYFRPSFHYPDLSGTPPGRRERLTQWRKRRMLAAALRNPHLTHLFCLDPYVIPHIDALDRSVQAVPLPDGITLYPPRQSRTETRTGWGVPDDRRVALLFGAIDSRKGVFPVIEALHRLPAEAQQQLALVLVGSVGATEKAPIYEAVERLRARTAIQVILDDRFIPDEEIPEVVGAADLALITYQRHVGSSNVLVRAAAASVPVLGSDYGLVGAHLERHRLGLPVDATDPAVLARAFARWLDAPEAFPFDARKAHLFAAAHTAERFAETIFRPAFGQHLRPAEP